MPKILKPQNKNNENTIPKPGIPIKHGYARISSVLMYCY